MRISLSIITSKRKFSFRLFQCIFFISIIAFFATLVMVDQKKIYLTLGAIAFTSGLFVTYLKEYNISGLLKLETNQITITDSLGEEKIYPMSFFNKIVITYREYRGERYPFNPQSIGLANGLNNYIELGSKNTSQLFEILVEDRKDMIRINELVRQWRKQSLDITLVNQWGRRVEQF